jgi:hypothetical protein
VPAQALGLVLAASIYPPAVAAVIALGHGPDVRWRVAAFVLAAAITTYAVGVLLLFVLVELGATGSRHRSPSAALDLALGLLLLGLAWWLARPRSGPRRRQQGGDTAARIETHLQSRRLAFVLGITLYVLPSPIYIAAVKSLADAKLSTSAQLSALVAMVAVMLWMIELPMLALIFSPARAGRELDRVNRWFARNGRSLAIVACACAGAYLSVKGLVDVLG